MKNLTYNQKATIDFIKSFTDFHGFQPSLDDMAIYFNVTKSAIKSRLDCIEKKGFIEQSGQSRAIKIKEK